MLKQLTFGTTGQSVSEICLGALYFGSKVSNAVSDGILDHFVAMGGNFIDTANQYAFWVPGCKGGESEQYLGDWMHRRRNRGNVFIASKCGFPYTGVESGLSSIQITNECEKSLRRLRIDTLDLYYAHGFDPITPIAEQLAAFHELVKSGKVRFIGASNFTASQFNESLSDGGLPAFSCIQQRYTYLQPVDNSRFEFSQVAADTDLLRLCSKHQKVLLPYSILLNGAYTMPDRQVPDQYKRSDASRRLEILRRVAEACNTTLPALIVSWLQSHALQVVPVIGASSIAQLAEQLNGTQVRLTEISRARLGVPD